MKTYEHDYNDPMMISLVFDNGMEFVTNFTCKGFTDQDLETIRIYANLNGKISIKNFEEAGYEEIIPIFPAISNMNELAKLHYQKLIFRKICEACSHKITYIKENHKDSLSKFETPLKYYWLIRKMCTFTHRKLSKRSKELMKTMTE